MTGLHAALAALLDQEMAEAADRGARSARADVRCLDCRLRYDERDQYGCVEPAHGHSYDEDELAEAAERGRQLDPDCVSVSVAEVRALLAEHPATPRIDAVHIERQRAWSLRTFGPGPRTAALLAHIRKELAEIEADPSAVVEWMDVVILAIDGAWRAGHEPQAIIDALLAKHAENEVRTWPDWRTVPANQPIEHVRHLDPCPVGGLHAYRGDIGRCACGAVPGDLPSIVAAPPADLPVATDSTTALSGDESHPGDRCPEHGPRCSGPTCCCRDKHRGLAPTAPEPSDRAGLSEIEKAANTALSVWSTTCHAYCSEEDRVHSPECLLAAGLHRSLADRLAVAEEAADQARSEVEHWRGMHDDATAQLRLSIREAAALRTKNQRLTEISVEITQERDRLRAQVAAVLGALDAHAFGQARPEWRTESHNGAHDVVRVDHIRAALGDPGPWVDRLKTEGAVEALEQAREQLDAMAAQFVAMCTAMGLPFDDERRAKHAGYCEAAHAVGERARVLRDGEPS